jgi:prepilin-type N-terminal cleavage/methylation domain-containing protein
MMRTARKRRRGFTLIEVMVSLGIMTIGAMAVIALQTQTIRANSYARQVTTATQIAQIWIERIKEDACMWTTPAALNGGTPDVPTVLNRTLYLQSIVTNAGRWITPADQDPFPRISRGFDFQGDDTTATMGGTTAPFYCTAYRMQWVYLGSAIRTDVRVWWPRAGSNARATDFPACGSNSNLSLLDPGGSAYGNYHGIYLSTVLHVTQLNR